MSGHSTLRQEAVSLHQSGDLDKAARAYAKYLAQVPEDAGMWSNLGVLHRAQGRHKMALRAHRLNNYANILSDIGDYDASIDVRRRLLAKTPDSLNHLAMIGRCLRGKGAYQAAVEHLEAAIADHPEDAELQLQLAFALLGQGDYMAGFAAYEARWRTGDLKQKELSYPKWQGDKLRGKSITILPEQGFGDAVLFMRFLPALKDMGAHVRVVAEGPMRRLFEELPGADAVVPVSEADEPTDYWANMMDVAIPALASGDIPPPTKLTIPGDSAERAVSTVQPFKDKLKVGVVWSGSATYKGNAFRSFTHREYLPLTDIEGVQLFSLYKGPFLKGFYQDGADSVMIDCGSQDRDFADCAAMMQEMDLIITSDTATAHIAGSLGVPTWVVLHWDPFWVWRHEGSETIWYQTARLFRQKRPLQWDSVMDEVREALLQHQKGG